MGDNRPLSPENERLLREVNGKRRSEGLPNLTEDESRTLIEAVTKAEEALNAGNEKTGYLDQIMTGEIPSGSNDKNRSTIAEIDRILSGQWRPASAEDDPQVISGKTESAQVLREGDRIAAHIEEVDKSLDASFSRANTVLDKASRQLTEQMRPRGQTKGRKR